MLQKRKDKAKNRAISERLRDFILPNKNNNYQPHILHPHRLAFHALSVLVIKVIVVVTIVGLPLSAFLTPDILAVESNKIIDLTNNLRQSSGLNTLAKSSLLTQAASQKAQDMLILQYFSHVSPDNKNLLDFLKNAGYQYTVAGENLAMGFSSAEEVMKAWQKSQTHNNNLLDPDFKEIGVAMASGVYKTYDTTMVAQFFGTAKIGSSNPIPNTSKSALAKPNIPLTKQPITKVTKKVEGVRISSEPKMDEPFLRQPELISPPNMILNNKEVILKIYSPQAEKIAIYNFDLLVSETNNLPNGYADVGLALPEGENKLKIIATKGQEQKQSIIYQITIDTILPAVDLAKTKISLMQKPEQSDQVIQAVAYLSPDTTQAQVNFADYKIDLQPNQAETGQWIGSLIITDENSKDLFNPLVLPNIKALDQAGNQSLTDITWQNIVSLQPSISQQYFFLKAHQSPSLKLLFDVSSIYYKIILLICISALLLNIFVEIKKQHPHLILSTLGLIVFLVLMIRF